MAISGTHQARYSTCIACDQCIHRPAVWQWVHCGAVAGEPAALDPAYMEGPTTNCPLAKWDGLEPVDMEQAAFDARRRRRLKHCPEGRRRMNRLVEELLALTTPAHALTILANTIPAFNGGLWELVAALNRLVKNGTTALPTDAATQTFRLTFGQYRTLAVDPGIHWKKQQLRIAFEEGAITSAEATELADELDQEEASRAASGGADGDGAV
jgi:hypothetical protein